jgi:hypothetical protein
MPSSTIGRNGEKRRNKQPGGLYILIDGGDLVQVARLTAATDSDPRTWTVEFDGWKDLSTDQKRFLLTVIGDCSGEWWGEGRAAFWCRQAALDAITRVIALGAVSGAPVLAA